ncbi:hypothetical protein BB561_003011 [Smittium simulii]|uniref:Arrestin-like N-terminal domain-containing protein n=1 Tax=Smittium simulii TaxID=133385 RepID=A0A2T9YN88_9FUNG|nr:hypothetical protein BB561_003011 [Smittium simulii]
MSTVTHFEVCFPTHGNKVPIFRPGASVSGTVVLKLDSPLAASYIELSFTGTELIFSEETASKNPASTNVLVRNSDSSNSIPENVELHKEFFNKDVLLWGNYLSSKHAALSKKKKEAAQAAGTALKPKVDESDKIRIIDSGTAHTYHFNVIMPKVNMPISKKTDKFQIKYTLKATIYSQSSQQPGKPAQVKAICTTSIREFNFEPIITETIEIKRGSLPFRDSIFLRESTSSNPSTGLKKLIKGSSDKPSDKHIQLIVFQPYPSYMPGEMIDILLLVPSGKSPKTCSYNFIEVIKCKKSSAPTIDDSQVPLLWSTSNNILSNVELNFSKLSKASVSSDLGLMGRFMFTNLSSSESSKLNTTIVKNESNISPQESIINTRASITPSRQINLQKDHASPSNMSIKNLNILSQSPTNQSINSMVSQMQLSKNKSNPRFQRNKVPIVPVPLGNLLSSESYKFARIRFNLPETLDLCSVPSVFLDFDYIIELNVTTSSSFSSTKKLVGRISLRTITKRVEVGSAPSTTTFHNQNASITPAPYHGSSSKPYELTKDEILSAVKLDTIPESAYTAISNIPNPMPGVQSNTDFFLEGRSRLDSLNTKSGQNDKTLTESDSQNNSTSDPQYNSEDVSFPNLQYYIQYGEKIPTPEIELVKIK